MLKVKVNFKLGRRLVHALSTTMASYKGLCSWVIERGRGHAVSAAPATATKLVMMMMMMMMMMMIMILHIITSKMNCCRVL